MGKQILFILAGIITGGVVVYLIESLGHTLFPPPADINFNDPEALRKMMQNAPFGSLIFVILAWAIGTYCGALVTSLLVKYGTLRSGVIVGFVMMVFGIFNLFFLPGPNWFTIVGILVFIPFAYLGGMTAVKIKLKRQKQAE